MSMGGIGTAIRRQRTRVVAATNLGHKLDPMERVARVDHKVAGLSQRCMLWGRQIGLIRPKTAGSSAPARSSSHGIL